MIRVDNLFKRYGSHEVLKGISFEVKKGTVYGFLGQNGTGKSTTMNILAGLINYNQGKVIINDLDMKLSRKKIIKQIGYLPEEPKFYPYMNAYEYLKFIGEISGLTRKEIYKKTGELLEKIKLKKDGKRKIGGYSRGMKQRLGLAAAVYNNPSILFLDEPSSALDPEGRRDILEIIQDLSDNNITVFLSTHILSDIERVSDEIAILDDGNIILQGSLDSLMSKYILPVYDIELESLNPQLESKLLTYQWVDKLKTDKNIMSIYVNDQEKAKDQLLKVIANSNIQVLSYNKRKSNLEDVFIRVVNKNEKL